MLLTKDEIRSFLKRSTVLWDGKWIKVVPHCTICELPEEEWVVVIEVSPDAAKAIAAMGAGFPITQLKRRYREHKREQFTHLRVPPPSRVIKDSGDIEKLSRDDQLAEAEREATREAIREMASPDDADSPDLRDQGDEEDTRPDIEVADTSDVITWDDLWEVKEPVRESMLLRAAGLNQEQAAGVLDISVRQERRRERVADVKIPDWLAKMSGLKKVYERVCSSNPGVLLDMAERTFEKRA